MHILIIDSDTNLNKTLATYLRAQGYLVFIETTLTGAVSALFTTKPRIVFIDANVDDKLYVLFELIDHRISKVALMMYPTDKVKDIMPDYLLTKPFDMDQIEKILKSAWNSIDASNYSL